MNLSITTCDIHEEAITFIENTLHTSSLLSHPEPEQVKLDSSTYDIVFVYPFSHMPDTTWFRWLQTLYNAVSLAAYSFSQLMDIKVKSTSAFPL